MVPGSRGQGDQRGRDGLQRRPGAAVSASLRTLSRAMGEGHTRNVPEHSRKDDRRAEGGRQAYCRPRWIYRDCTIERHAGRGFRGYGARTGKFERVHLQILKGFQEEKEL